MAGMGDRLTTPVEFWRRESETDSATGQLSDIFRLLGRALAAATPQATVEMDEAGKVRARTVYTVVCWRNGLDRLLRIQDRVRLYLSQGPVECEIASILLNPLTMELEARTYDGV